MIEGLFVVSAVVGILFLVATIGVLVGRNIDIPLPLLHFINTKATNCYLSCPAIGFQVWFWAKHFGVLV